MYKLAVLSVLLGLAVAYKDSNNDKSIELPVKSKHDLQVIKVPSKQEDHSTNVDIPSGVLPVYMLFRTQSSPLYVKQEHRGTKGSSQKSDSEDEPHTLVHEVIKPVIQELKEVITPYRKVVQIIEKVQEERLTKVHKNEGNNGNGNGNGNDNGKGRNGYDNDDDDDDKKNDNDNNDNDSKKYGSIDQIYKRFGLSYE